MSCRGFNLQVLSFYHPHLPTGFGTFWLRRNVNARPWCNRPCIGYMQRSGRVLWLQRPQVSRLDWEMVKVRLPLAEDLCRPSSPAFLTATLPKDQNLVQWLQELSVDPATIQTVSTHQPKAAPLSSSFSNFLTAAKMLHTGKALSTHLLSYGWRNSGRKGDACLRILLGARI